MARIVLSLSGEGRGHAARTLSVLQMLSEHKILILAPNGLEQWLQAATQRYANIEIQRLPSLSFQYHASGKLSYVKSWLVAAPFLRDLKTNLQDLQAMVERFGADLAIADFEPLLPRVARRAGIPLLSLDHQHFLSAMDTRCLPLSLRLRTWFLRPSVKMFCPSADRYLVSSFFRYPQRKAAANYEQIGVLLRNEIGRRPSQIGDHVLVYARRNSAATWLPKLNAAGHKCLVYGCEPQTGFRNLEFRPICNHQFIEDLVTCRALITTAGNQLVGEAMATGKPVFAIPEHGNFEQQLNGHFLQKSGMGRCVMPQHLTVSALRSFMDQLSEFRRLLVAYPNVGNDRVRQCIQSMLSNVATETTPETLQLSEVSQ